MLKLFPTFALLVLLPVFTPAQHKVVNDKNLASALAVVQANANHPGDETLDCAGLEKELVASVNDPAVRLHFAKAQKKQVSVTKLQTGVSRFSPFSVSSATVFTKQTQVAQFAAQDLQQRVRQMGDLLAIAPQLMRGQRILQLAQARNCRWVQISAAERSTGHEAGH